MGGGGGLYIWQLIGNNLESHPRRAGVQIIWRNSCVFIQRQTYYTWLCEIKRWRRDDSGLMICVDSQSLLLCNTDCRYWRNNSQCNQTSGCQDPYMHKTFKHLHLETGMAAFVEFCFFYTARSQFLITYVSSPYKVCNISFYRWIKNYWISINTLKNSLDWVQILLNSGDTILTTESSIKFLWLIDFYAI
jgi:hypothetical protein